MRRAGEGRARGGGGGGVDRRRAADLGGGARARGGGGGGGGLGARGAAALRTWARLFRVGTWARAGVAPGGDKDIFFFLKKIPFAESHRDRLSVKKQVFF